MAIAVCQRRRVQFADESKYSRNVRVLFTFFSFSHFCLAYTNGFFCLSTIHDYGIALFFFADFISVFGVILIGSCGIVRISRMIFHFACIYRCGLHHWTQRHNSLLSTCIKTYSKNIHAHARTRAPAYKRETRRCMSNHCRWQLRCLELNLA